MCSCFIWLSRILYIFSSRHFIFCYRHVARVLVFVSSQFLSLVVVSTCNAFFGPFLYSMCHFKCPRQKILFTGFIAFHVNFFTPVCFTLPAQALHARTQVTVYLLNLDIIYFHCQIQPVLFLWTLQNISTMLQFYRNAHRCIHFCQFICSSLMHFIHMARGC